MPNDETLTVESDFFSSKMAVGTRGESRSLLSGIAAISSSCPSVYAKEQHPVPKSIAAYMYLAACTEVRAVGSELMIFDNNRHKILRVGTCLAADPFHAYWSAVRLV